MIKHFVTNDDEGGQFERWTKAIRVPTRAMHELYLLPFEMAIRDGDAASVMCAFPHLNFEWACQNQDLLIRTLRQRWGFKGYVESDRRAVHSTAGSILARMSIELDSEPEFYSADNVMAALAAGEITEADIDELLRGRYLKMFEFGHFDNPYNAFLPHRLRGHAAVARQAAEEGIVLLKNEGNFLPLTKEQSGPSRSSAPSGSRAWLRFRPGMGTRRNSRPSSRRRSSRSPRSRGSRTRSRRSARLRR